MMQNNSGGGDSPRERGTDGRTASDGAPGETRVLTFYSTDACHLCDAAEDLLMHVKSEGAALDWERVDIAGDDALFARYGWLIPVLRDEEGRELRWPFDYGALRRYLGLD